MKPDPMKIRSRDSIHRNEDSDEKDQTVLKGNRNSLSRNGSDVEDYEEGERSIAPENDTLYERESATPQLNRQEPRIFFNKFFVLPFLIVIVPAIVAIIAYFKTNGLAYSQSDVKRNCSFKNLQNDYPKEANTTWKHLQLGIENILNKQSENSAVYLLINHGSQNGTKLINKIAVQSSGCFGKELIPMRMNDFMPSPGSLDDYGHVIAKYKSKIEEGNVFLIANLNEIPAKAARALHFICDTHSPINKEVVIFLTLNLPESKKRNTDSLAVEALTELWGSHLKPNELDPLITRVTDQVIVLKS